VRPRRLLYIITLAEYGGAQAHLSELMRGFHRKFELHLATSSEGPITAQARELGVTVHLLAGLQRAINPLDDLRSVVACRSLLTSLRPDLVHLHSSKAGLIGRVAAWAEGVPVVFTAHGWGFKPGVPLARRAVVWGSERAVADLAHRIICVSEYDRALALRYGIGDRERLVTIHNGLALEAPQATPGAAGDVTFAMTARFQEPKEQSLLLRAFAAAAPEARLAFIGDGPQLAASKELAENLGIADRVSFYGDRGDVPALLARAHVFVLLSRYEGLPISILEAMRAGLPVIASGVGGVPELLRHGDTGFLVPNEVRAVAGAVATLAASPELRQRMGAAGRRRFAQEFALDQMLSRIEAVYEAALS
jgi:glycosyltransferase involved in cell wall biosynthesis